jgi:inositol phosphorylceramide synthase catalytic subunit
MTSPVRPVNREEPPLKLGAAAAALYILVMLAARKIGWQHLGLVALAWACLTPLPRARRFIRDWWPMILFWLSYDLMRIFSASLLDRVSVEAPFRWESTLFNAPDGTIWPFFFARWTAAHGAQTLSAALSLFCSLVYLTQLFGIPVIMMILWLRGSAHFKPLVWAYTAMHAMTLIIYFSYPAAPPWWVYQNGLAAPGPELSMPQGLERGSVLAGLFHFSPNRFAAIPSLHGAYPLLLTAVLAMRREKWGYVAAAAAYTASMWFSCVFLNQHYIVDLLIGAALVLPAVFAPRLIR